MPKDKRRCQHCGYTEDDAKLHLDHHLCKEGRGNAPWERKAKREAKG